MFYLEIHEGESVRTFPLQGESISIGRRRDNDIVISDDRASRHHCTLEPVDEGFLLSDLGSRNGTKVNGSKVGSAMVNVGDEIRIGQTTFNIVEEVEVVPVELEELAEAELASEPESIPMAILDDTDVGGEEASNGTSSSTAIPEVEDIEPARASERLAMSLGSDLRKLITAGLDVGFGLEDIALLDRQGQVVHAASKTSGDHKAVRTLRSLLLGAFRLRATDMHFEPRGNEYKLRFRVDGSMLPVLSLPQSLGTAVLSVVKILCEIDISKTRIVQEGGFAAQVPTRSIDFRISFTPTVHGQKLVMRILDKTVVPRTLHDLGMPTTMLRSLRTASHQDTGMVVVSGPTGSGKTTTLYTALRELDATTKNIITIEDPVEYQVEGITQVPVDARQHLTFANLLVSMLRQDPDVILVGEIRDPETARVAVQAAMTGHLVFTTLHARDSVGSIFRLIDLGVEPYMVANSLSLCLAQRLVRVLCSTCKRPFRPGPTELVKMHMENRGVQQLYTHVGCERCMGVGFLGRIAVFETLSFNDDLRDALLTKPTIQSIRKAAGQWSFQTLLDSAYEKVAEGITSLEEAERVASQE